MCSFVAALEKHIEGSSPFYYTRFIFFLVYLTIVALTSPLLLLGVILPCFLKSHRKCQVYKMARL